MYSSLVRTSRRLQLFVALLSSVLALLALRMLPLELLSGRDAFDNSFIAGLAGVAVAIISQSRVSSFPGVSSIAAIIPSFLFGASLVFAWFLVTRTPYSNIVLTMAFGSAFLTALLFEAIRVKTQRMSLHVVPGGKVDRLSELEGVDLVWLTRPELPANADARIVADLHFEHPKEWEAMLANAALRSMPVFHYKSVVQSLTGRVQIDHLSENIYGSLLPNLGYMWVKRIADTLITIVALPVLVPLLAVIAVVVRLDSPGPALFRQSRIGHRGKEFTVYKIRTMKVAEVDSQADARIAAMTRDNDDRVTRIGSFLRRTRLDELPQALNVLKGEMSWIGPRPEAHGLAEWYESEVPFYAYRHVVRPGITGWAQVNQGHVTGIDDIHQKLQYDFYYIANFSYWLDALIVMRSFVVVFTGTGAR